MKSILIVTEAFEVGGLETHISGEINTLSSLGWSVHLACGRRFDNRLLSKKLSSLTTGLGLDPDSSIDDWLEAVRTLESLAREQNITHIHAHPFTSLFPALCVAETLNLPLAISLHGPVSITGVYGPLYDYILTQLVLPQAGLVIAISEEVALLSAPYAPTDRLKIIPNSVSTLQQDSSNDTPKSAFWLAVSRLDQDKLPGIEQFIQYAYTSGIAHVKVAGDGRQMPEFKARLEQAGLSDYVSLLGYRDDVSSLMEDAQGVAGMGRVVLEGIASNKPTVLVGYDGVKGLVTPDFFKMASTANFSGRGLKNISASDFSRQLLDINEHNHKDCMIFIEKDFLESKNWSSFSDLLLAAPPTPSHISCAVLKALQHIAPLGEGNSHLQSNRLFREIGQLVHSPAFSSENHRGAYSYYSDSIALERIRNVENNISVLKDSLSQAHSGMTRINNKLDSIQRGGIFKRVMRRIWRSVGKKRAA